MQLIQYLLIKILLIYLVIVLSHAIEVGSPMNHLGSRQRRDMDQGPFSPLKIRTDTGPVLLRQGEPGMPQYIETVPNPSTFPPV